MDLENKKIESIEEENFELMLEDSYKRAASVLVDGVIVGFKDGYALVDIGRKVEALLNLEEIKSADDLKYNMGDRITVLVVGSKESRPLVSFKKAIRKKATDEFLTKYTENEDLIIDGKIVEKNKGGYIVIDNNNIEYFLPKSQAMFKDENVIGKFVKGLILKVDKDNSSIVISRKKLIENDKKKKRKIIKDMIDSNNILEGTVKKITSFGMFVDVNGVEGLVHYSEISYKGPVNPAKYYSEGDKVPVKALEYNKDKKYLALSIKATIPNPWEEIKDELEVGDVIKVTVSNIEPYGAFVDLGNDIEAFLHVSEISWDKRPKHPKDYLTVGEVLDVEVIEIDIEKKKLRVSLKNLLQKPFEEFEKKYKVGDISKGVVTSITDFGAFVKIDTIEGLLHNEDASWNKNEKCKDIFKEGDEIDIKIVSIDGENEKVSLTRKELFDSPIKQFEKSHKINDAIHVKVKDKKEFGIFVELNEHIDGLIRTEDLHPYEIDKLEIGQQLEAIITQIDSDKNRIRLSVRRLSGKKEKETLESINDNSKITLGDIVKN
ncbi:MAG: 30S ribosomal protein S1 [Campylobacterales bacterium]|nr:30S ribosomal protein S1 [Campylobacterales bacterium]